MFKRFLIALSLVALPLSAAQASVILILTDDGAGNTAYTLTGTYDLTNAPPIGQITLPSAPAPSRSGVGSNLELAVFQWAEFAPNVSGNVQNLSSTMSSGEIFNANFGQSPAPLSPNLQLDFTSASSPLSARIIAGSDNLTGTLNASGIWSNIAFSVFNAGVWEWGNPTVANQGMRLQIGPIDPPSAPIPLPAGGLLLLGGLGAVALIRRKQA